jgi:tRNA dimethylallyltransferase
LHAELEAIDPDAARRIEPADRQRIQRALEVHAVTGRPLTELQRTAASSAVSVDSIALMPADREHLKRAIELRFDSMVEQGLIEEVRRLRERPGLTAASASMRAVGYRQIWGFLAGQWGWPEAARRAVVATRQLAKRQLTWLRSDRQTEQLGARDPVLADLLAERVRRQLEIA